MLLVSRPWCQDLPTHGLVQPRMSPGIVVMGKRGGAEDQEVKTFSGKDSDYFFFSYWPAEDRRM